MQPNGHATSADQPFTPARFGIFLALLILAAFPQVVFGLETFVARDYGFFAYPLAHFQQVCFRRGELPFWDPYNDCGVPFLAQWNTMPLYPPALLYLTLPLTWALGFFSLLHLWFAGLGMFFLARRWTNNSLAAAFAGTAFAFNGFTLNLLMWPSHIATFGWMPWVVLAAEGAWRDGGRKIPLAALAGAMQMLAGGPETIFLTWLIVSALWARQFVTAETPRFRLLWRFPLVLVLVFGLSAAQLLPFLDLVRHAQRETGYTDLRWSMPGSGLANFLVPMAFGSAHTEGIFFQRGQAWTSSYYLGIGTLWLALAAVLGVRERRLRLLAALATLALLCALGENTPFYPLVRQLIPQLSFITYPVKFVMVAVFAAPLLAAFALANLTTSRRRLLPLGAILLALLGGIIVWTQRASLPGEDAQAALFNGLSRAAFLVLTGSLLLAMARGGKSPRLRFAPLLLILTAWLDVFTHEPSQNPTAPPSIYELNLARARLAMDPQPELGGSRAMLSPSATLGLLGFAVSNPKNNYLAKRLGYCADANLLDGVPKVDGFFSLTPREFDGLLSFTYCVTNANWTGLQDFLGVSQYSSPTNFLAWQPRTGFLPLVTVGQEPVFEADTNALWAFARNDFDPRKSVFLPPDEKSSISVSHPTTARVLDCTFTPQTVDFKTEATETSLAVIAQTSYHNWHATIDGRPAPLLRANVAFQAVQVPAGAHQVRLFYRDEAFRVGADISIFAGVLCLAGGILLRRPTPKIL